MSSDGIDWSKLPQSKYGDDDFFRLLVPDEIAKLPRLHQVILNWQAATTLELEHFEQHSKAKHQPWWDEYDYDPVREESVMLLETERAMFASLAVSIASTAEHFIVRLCKHRNVSLTDADGESDFGIICENFSKSIGVTVSSLPGYPGNQRARFLGNCYKHNGGMTDSRFAKKYKTTEGEIIEYETENWTAMIDETRALLFEICDRLELKQKT